MEVEYLPAAERKATRRLTVMRKRMWNRRLIVVAALGPLALVGVSGTSFADDNDSVPVDLATRDKIFQQIMDLPIPGLDGLSVGLDPVGQKIGVTIFAPDGLPAVAIGRLKFGANVTVDVAAAEGPNPNADIAGGEVLLPAESSGKSTSCTAGFAVGVQGGISGFLTAGHCFDMNEPAVGQEAFVGDYDSVSIFGHERVYGPSDWGIYLFSEPAEEDEENHALPEIVTDTATLPISGIAQPTVGMPVCKHGITTDTTCGTVKMLDVKSTYRAATDANGVVIRPKVDLEGLVETDFCNEPGDSGGPVYTTVDGKTMAVGIISGGTWVRKDLVPRCLETVGKTNVSYIVPISATSIQGTDPSAAVFLKVEP